MNSWERECRPACQRLRSVIFTDDAGVHHRLSKFCGNPVMNDRSYCKRCEEEILQEGGARRQP